jgi:hypothetical protein
MGFEIDEWASPEAVGKAFRFKHHGKFHGILETRVGAYRGNHIHPHDQYTLLLKGRAKYVLFEGERREDAFTFEWWDGDFIADDVTGIFDDLTRDRVGPKG